MATNGQLQKNGLAIIITNDYSETNKTVLKGPHKDGEKMAHIFQQLNYETRFWKNFSLAHLQYSLEHLVSTINHSMYKCIVVIFSGHGTTDERTKLACIFTHEPQCQLYPVQELVNYFMPSNTPNIATTPKVFLIDACLGNKSAIDEAVVVPISKGPSEPVVTSKSGHSIRTITVPPDSNYILAHSTSIGYKSFETEACGGLWLDVLGKKIREKAYYDTVLSILTDVNADLLQMYQSFKSVMTQPHIICQSHGRIYFVPQELPCAQNTEQGFTRAFYGPPQVAECQSSSTGQPNSCRTRLNNMNQAKKISEPKYHNRQVPTENGLKFLATVTFQYLLNSEMIYCQSEPKDLKKEADEEAAKNACMRIDLLEKSTSKSALCRQSSSPQLPPPIRKQPPPRRQVSSSSDNTPVQILKMGCESAKPRYTYDLYECTTGVLQMFQFTVVVRDDTGRVLCQETGSRKENKKQAKHDAASKANAKLGF